MTFNDNARIDSSRVQRRGRSAGDRTFDQREIGAADPARLARHEDPRLVGGLVLVHDDAHRAVRRDRR